MIKIMVDNRERECYIEIDSDSEMQTISEAFMAFNSMVQEIAQVHGRSVADRFLLTLYNAEKAGALGLLTLAGGDGANAGG